MGVKLLPPRLYKSELANSESLRDMLLLEELDTAKGGKQNIENKYNRMLYFVILLFHCTKKYVHPPPPLTLKFCCP